MNLEDLIALSKDKVRESMPKPEETDGYDAAYIENLVGEIAIGAIKFQDLKTPFPPDMSLSWKTLPNSKAKPAHTSNMRLPVSIPFCAKQKKKERNRETS